MHRPPPLAFVLSAPYQVPRWLTGWLLCLLPALQPAAQDCPPNIDFETGGFSRWTCYTGNTSSSGGQNFINIVASSPMQNRHTMYTSPNGGTDPYGNFPVNCPNGSGHSIRLGNNTGGGEAEGIAYEFTIPAGRNEYSLIYHYAVVFEDPRHEQHQQPRMQVEVANITDGEVLSCASFSFVPYGSPLPGFFQSAIRGDDGAPVWCKDWSAVSINLDGLAGKTIRLFFKTADCTFRRHFGYAYIDVNSECSSEFVGAAYCPDDTAVTVTAPYGYQAYTWFNSNFSSVIGRSQVMRFNPPPPSGTTIAVEVVPFDGYGCIDTLYARLLDTLTVTAFAGADQLYCGESAVRLGVNPRQGLVYAWTPSAGLSNAAAANPLATPTGTTTYTLAVRSAGGGCLNHDAVTVTSSSVSDQIALDGKEVFCLGQGDSAVLRVGSANPVTWYRDGQLLSGQTSNRYPVTQTGVYTALVRSPEGCQFLTKPQRIEVDKARPGIQYPLEYAVENKPYQLQCRDFGSEVLWTPATSLNDVSAIKPIFTGLREQSYRIRIKTITGCLTVDTQTVKTVKQPDIFVPTAFTPNNDGRNDLLMPVTMGIKALRYFRVYNRWGQLLFETQRPFTGWDGRVNGVLQSTGVVVWVAEGLGADGQTHQRKGHAALLR